MPYLELHNATKQMPNNTTLINSTLSVTIVVLSFYTISWHKQNHALYKTAKKTQTENQKITALNKQLLAEHATQVSAEVIKKKTAETLDMDRPKKINPLKL